MDIKYSQKMTSFETDCHIISIDVNPCFGKYYILSCRLHKCPYDEGISS